MKRPSPEGKCGCVQILPMKKLVKYRNCRTMFCEEHVNSMINRGRIWKSIVVANLITHSVNGC